MAVRPTAALRNILLTGHSGCGKTTLTERLLLDAGVLTRMGTVEDGNTVSDWTDEEKHHGHSLQPSLVHFDHDGAHVNLLDTPGRTDFLGHTIGCLPAVEMVAVTVDAAKGVESVTRRIMSIASDRNLPRMIVVNKIDDSKANLEEVMAGLVEAFGTTCLPINLPAEGRESVIDVFEHHDEAATEFSSVGDAHTRIVEQVVEVDEDLMTEYLDVGDADALDKKKVHEAFERALREGHLVPVCFVSAKTGAGVGELLHVFSHLCPSPLEGNPRTFIKNGEEFFPDATNDGGEVVAHVFKVTSDPFVGKLGIFRVHQGIIKAKDELYVNEERKAVRLGHLLRLQGKDHDEVDAIGPGDLAAVSKIDEISFDAVLHSSHDSDGMRLRALPLPKPMYGQAIELTNHADEAKFGGAVAKLQAEDPCFVVERIAATKQTVMRGLGELHLRVVLEKLKAAAGIVLETSQPKVAYKETIQGQAEGHHRHKKQTGGAGQFGEVYLRVAPLPVDHETGFEFENCVVGGSIPRQFMPAIEKGVRSVLSDGAIAGYPLTGVRVEVYDGKYHPVDSKEVAFITAGKKAFIDAIQKASPALLEPFVTLEITVPSDHMGDITGDLSTKRGRVQTTDMVGSNMCVITAQAPLSEVQNYTNELKSITQGTGSFTMDYSHDEQTPPHIQQEVVAAFKPHDDD